MSLVPSRRLLRRQSPTSCWFMEATGISWFIQMDLRKKDFIISTGMGCPESWSNLHPWRLSRSKRTKPKALWSEFTVDPFWTPDLQRSLNDLLILCDMLTSLLSWIKRFFLLFFVSVLLGIQTCELVSKLLSNGFAPSGLKSCCRGRGTALFKSYITLKDITPKSSRENTNFKVLGDFVLNYGVNPDRNTPESHSSNCLFPPNKVIMAVIDELMNSAHKIETAFTKYMHHRHLITLRIVQGVMNCSKGKLNTPAWPKCLACMKPGKRGKITLILLGQNRRGEVGKGVP